MSGDSKTLALPRDDVLFEPTPDGGVLLDLRSETYFQLDEVSAEIWTLLGDKEGRLDEVVSALVEAYDASRAQIDQETRDFVGSLVEAGLVTTG